MLEQNLQDVQSKIESACKRAGREPKEVTLIAVSKTKPEEMLQTIYDCGVRDFGENKVQELTRKIEALPNDIKWHMIGHLQTNKVKYIVGSVELIHSVDSIHLAKEISKQSVKKDVVSHILIEVNVAEEESKFGLKIDEVLSAIKEISKLPNLKIDGLMTIAPYVINPEDNRNFFRRIKQLAVDISEQNIDNVSMNILSMGMTGDYEVAIEEGATIVRVGTGIFGERNYKK
ncbi:MAG: YggS family pyridoxal phosphate-dependent enzyme [Lachnobacterium sp.]|nr:YggS family pyridoxal phosphate-dependent enzyme [Lachnobacterium sp.]